MNHDQFQASSATASAPPCRSPIVRPFAFRSVLALGGLLAACTAETVGSDSIRTGGLHARMRAISPGDGTTVLFVDLAVGGQGGTKVDLTGTDELVYNLESGQSGRFQQRESGHFQAAFRGDGAAELTIALNRDDGTDASSTVLLPEPYSVRWPEGLPTLPTVSRAESATVLWSPVGATGASTVDWELSGDCIWTERGTARDDGELSLPAEAVRVRPTRQGEACDVQWRLDRRAVGEVTANWVSGSSIEALQSRALTFRSSPAAEELGEEEAEADSADVP